MLTVTEALEAVLEHSRALPAASCPLALALDCVLAEDVRADLDSPPFDKALVDGYAVRSSDLMGPERWLAVGEAIMAGRCPTRALGQGEAAVVMTGAPIPAGCDAVVMHEQTRPHNEGVVVLEPVVKPGQNMLRRGREMRAGDVVVARGSVLQPARLGVLASVGRTEIAIVPRPRVAIVPTGDELVEPGQAPGPGQIRNSNAVMLHALAIEEGAHSEVLPIAPDLPEPLGRILARGLEFDLLVIAGGVSAGQRDLVPATLERLGVRRVFHKLRLKPGKPLWFGIGPQRGDFGGALVFGLPGNPVSGLVGFLLFVKMACRALAGKPVPRCRWAVARLDGPFVHRGDRTTFFPAKLVESADEPAGPPVIAPLDWAGSADLRTAAAADGFAVFQAGDREYASGDIVDYLPMRHPT
jgi:molybdopterin molybdotransferase